MKFYFAPLLMVVLAGSCLLPGTACAIEEELIIKSCSDLIRLAEQYNEDLKTVDTVLGSAIEYGSIDRIRNYGLRKAAMKKQLEAVMKALEIKGCIKTN